MSLESDHIAAILASLGRSCSVIAHGVAKLYLASPDPAAVGLTSPDSILSQYPEINTTTWTDAEVVGGVVLIRDKSQGSIMFQIYSLDQKDMLLFEYELYEGIEYQRLSDGVYCFEMDECVAGLAFADASIAKSFYSAVLKNTPKAPPPRPTRATRVEPICNLPIQAPEPLSPKGKKGKKKGSKHKAGKGRKRKGFFGKKNKPGMMGLSEIGEIERSEHKRHIGIDPSGNFNFKNLPMEWKMFFREAGIKKSDLRDPVIAKEMIRTIQTAEMNLAYGQQTYSKQQEPENYSNEQRQAFERYQNEMMRYNQDLEGRGTSFRNMNVNADVRASSYSSVPPERPPRRTRNGTERAESVYSSPPQKPPRRTESKQTAALPALKSSNKKFRRVEEEIKLPVAPTPLRIASNRELRKNTPDLATLDALLTPSVRQTRSAKTPERKPKKKSSGFNFLYEDEPKKRVQKAPETAKQDMVEVTRKRPVGGSSRTAPVVPTRMKEVKRKQPLGSTMLRFKNMETYEERAEPVVEIKEKIVEVVRYEESDELQRIKAEMEKLKAEAAEAKAKAEELERKQQDLIQARQAKDLEYQRELEAKQEELVQLQHINEELVLAKEKEEQEKEALREAKERADAARQELERQNHKTKGEREEALRKMAETQEAVKLAQLNLNATKNKLEEAQNLKAALEQQKQQEDQAYMQQLEAQQEKLAEVELEAEELKKEKAFEAQEKLILVEANRQADVKQQELLRQKLETEAEKAEALRKIREKEAEMKRAEASLQETNKKLLEAEERAKKLPPPPPSLKKLPKLPPLQRGGAAPAPPPLPPLPPPPSAQTKKPDPPPLPKTPEKKALPKGALNMNILAGITGGVKLVPVQKVKKKTKLKKEKKGLIAQLEQKQRQRALIKNKQNRRSVMKALSVRINRLSVGVLQDKKKANQLMSNLQAQMMLRRANLKGDGNESDDSDWSLE